MEGEGGRDKKSEWREEGKEGTRRVNGGRKERKSIVVD